ncbi:uncharacterized protein K452DRAFT_286452 [Aplosporella prunicola CBS 121167]|uniref:Uncharacterized protein n=1 Tax=Aplosporella prunicola CBS 121167 TaxID=1176127 RepID=A0A6A6BJ35_9PEZI|nr:uncharacterized protein K452DRAFT_286452 [Aplosporella prunicola CBS 121167]KAF2142827.1 hypothetical protein K452DRAFT_286452 [Aplosporella prunicola CBS 121167]
MHPHRAPHTHTQRRTRTLFPQPTHTRSTPSLFFLSIVCSVLSASLFSVLSVSLSALSSLSAAAALRNSNNNDNDIIINNNSKLGTNSPRANCVPASQPTKPPH